MNLDNQKLRAIQTSKTHLKKELEKETRPEIREKIQHYIDELTREENRILNESLDYIRYSAILEHLKSSDASWGTNAGSKQG